MAGCADWKSSSSGFEKHIWFRPINFFGRVSVGSEFRILGWGGGQDGLAGGGGVGCRKFNLSKTHQTVCYDIFVSLYLWKVVQTTGDWHIAGWFAESLFSVALKVFSAYPETARNESKNVPKCSWAHSNAKQAHKNIFEKMKKSSTWNTVLSLKTEPLK